jgi:hypothetical protein
MLLPCFFFSFPLLSPLIISLDGSSEAASSRGRGKGCLQRTFVELKGARIFGLEER